MHVQQDFLLVIPAYCERTRLPVYLRDLVGSLSAVPFTTTILVVDDGSPAGKKLRVSEDLQPGTYGSCVLSDPLLLPRNVGKGRAIVTGWTSGLSAERLAFVDADGAIPAYEVVRLFTECHDSNDTVCRFATRKRVPGLNNIKRRPLRHVCGRMYAAVVSALARTDFYDTQCGFKIIAERYLAPIQPLLKESGFCFDIELLLALRAVGAIVIEVPIDWEDKPGGHVNVLRHGPRMLVSLLLLLWRTRSWPAQIASARAGK